MIVTVFGIYITVSIVTFCVYAYDKSAARNGRWRTRESTLHILALTGGWPGALMAQRILRHKSRKPEFQRVFLVTVVLNWGLLLYLIQGSSALRSIFGSITP